MQIKSNEKKENSTVELVIEVGADEFNAAIDKVYSRQKKNIALPGWRKGKAPRKMVEAMYGARIFYDDAIEMVYPGAYEQALKEAGIEAVAYPTVEILQADKNGFSFKAVVTVRPEVRVFDYKGMAASKAQVTVSDEDVEKELRTYIDRATRLVSVDREARTGDVLSIDFEGSVDGEPFEGGSAENYSLELGSQSFIPGFEEQLEGVKAGEVREVNVTFPEDYHSKDLTGAAAVFKVTVHEVKERQVPDIDDEFAKDVSEFDTLEEFKASLADGIREKKQKDVDADFENRLVQMLVDEHMECDVPEAMVDYQTDRELDEFVRRVQAQGIRFEDYMRITHNSVNDVRAQIKEQARISVHMMLALEAVAQAEGLEVSPEELEAEYARVSDEHVIDVEQVKKLLPERDVRGDLLRKKAVDVLVSTAQVTPEGEENTAQ